MDKKKLLRIGELAQRMNVPVETIRYYSDIGVMPPTTITDAGHRYYSTEDSVRLEVIRALRDTGMSLPNIKELLQDNDKVSAVFERHLETLEASFQNLQRQQALIKLTLENGGDKPLRYFRARHAVVDLTKDEQRDFIARQLSLALFDIPAEYNWKSNVWFSQETVLGFSETIDTNQVQAWLEFVDLLADTSFQKELNESAKHVWNYEWQLRGIKAFQKDQSALLSRALGAAQAGETPHGEYAQALVSELLDINAKLLNRPNDSAFPVAVLQNIKPSIPPTFTPYWELLGRLKGQRLPKMWSKFQALIWLIEGLKERIFPDD